MVKLPSSKTPKKGGVSPAKEVRSPAKPAPKSPAKAAPKTPAKAAPKTPAKTPVKPSGKTPVAPIVQKTPVSRKRELKQEKQEEEEVETFTKKMKRTPGRKSLPAKTVVQEEPEIESDEAMEEESDGDDELDLNHSSAQIGDDDEDGEDEEEEEDEDEDDEDEEEEEDEDKDDEDEEEEGEDADEEEEEEETEVKEQESPKAVQAQAKSPLHETVIVVKSFRLTATVQQLKEHFADCGTITHCKMNPKNKGMQTEAFIDFKSFTEAKCAVDTKNGKPFQGKNIVVHLKPNPFNFTSENTVFIHGLSKGVLLNPHKAYSDVKTTMHKFGNITHIKFSKQMDFGLVQFEDNTGVAAALKAGHFELFDSKVKIATYDEYQSPETRLTIFGLTDAISEADVEAALVKHCPVVRIFYPKNKSKEEVKNQVMVLFKTEEAAEKIFAMKTLKVKNTALDILPYYSSVRYFDKETKVYHRHPAGVFVENLPYNMKYFEICQDLAKFGPVMRIDMYNRGQCALVIFEHKADAVKALKTSSPTVKNRAVTFHAADGVYSTPIKPALKATAETKRAVGTSNGFSPEDTVCISGVPNGTLVTPHKVYTDVTAAMNKFGNITCIKFSEEMDSGFVQFDDNTGVAAALKAGHFELLYSRVKITAYRGFQKGGFSRGTELRSRVGPSYPRAKIAAYGGFQRGGFSRRTELRHRVGPNRR